MVGVPPSDIHGDIEWPVAALREGGVIVADKAGERTPGQLHQLDAGDTALVTSNRDCVSTLVDRNQRPCAFATMVTEDVATGPVMAICTRNYHRGEGNFSAGHCEGVHLVIDGGEANTQKMEEPLHGCAGVGEGLPDDEVLHAIGRHE